MFSIFQFVEEIIFLSANFSWLPIGMGAFLNIALVFYICGRFVIRQLRRPSHAVTTLSDDSQRALPVEPSMSFHALTDMASKLEEQIIEIEKSQERLSRQQQVIAFRIQHALARKKHLQQQEAKFHKTEDNSHAALVEIEEFLQILYQEREKVTLKVSQQLIASQQLPEMKQLKYHLDELLLNFQSCTTPSNENLEENHQELESLQERFNELYQPSVPILLGKDESNTADEEQSLILKAS